MYTTGWDETTQYWKVYCPDGVLLACVEFEEEAKALLSHLNRSTS